MDDLKIRPEADRLEITLSGGEPRLSGGLATYVFLSLFTGDWWASDGLFGSQIPEIMGSGLLTLRTRQSVIDEARRVLAWLVDDRIAERVDVTAAIPQSGRLDLKVTIEQPGETAALAYGLNWEAQTVELLEAGNI